MKCICKAAACVSVMVELITIPFKISQHLLQSSLPPLIIFSPPENFQLEMMILYFNYVDDDDDVVSLW